MKEPVGFECARTAFPLGVLVALGNDLTLPKNGDIEFICPSKREGSVKSLFALSTVLTTRCEYYATSIPHLESALNVKCLHHLSWKGNRLAKEQSENQIKRKSKHHILKYDSNSTMTSTYFTTFFITYTRIASTSLRISPCPTGYIRLISALQRIFIPLRIVYY